MWMVVKVPDTDGLRDVLDRWQAAINAQAPERVAEAFAQDAVFQGLRPYSVGRQGVIDYYAAQQPGMTVTYQILESRNLSDDASLGYVKADFAFPERPTVGVYLGVLAQKRDEGWRIVYYQASKLDPNH
jgi:uncharacterized protein (TIGR02246 family)